MGDEYTAALDAPGDRVTLSGPGLPGAGLDVPVLAGGARGLVALSAWWAANRAIPLTYVVHGRPSGGLRLHAGHAVGGFRFQTRSLNSRRFVELASFPLDPEACAGAGLPEDLVAWPAAPS